MSMYPLQQVSMVNHDDEPISPVSSNEKDQVCHVRSEYNVSILVILRAIRHAYIITNNANHSYCQILGMRHQVDGCNKDNYNSGIYRDECHIK